MARNPTIVAEFDPECLTAQQSSKRSVKRSRHAVMVCKAADLRAETFMVCKTVTTFSVQVYGV